MARRPEKISAMPASAGPVTGSWRNSEPSSSAVTGISSVTSITPGRRPAGPAVFVNYPDLFNSS
jgi:hypothetical protein